jgi:hypothetical protein
MRLPAIAFVCVLALALSVPSASGSPSRGAALKECGSGYPLGRPEIFNVRARGMSCLHAVAIVMTAYASDLRSSPFVGAFRCSVTSDGEAAGTYRCRSGSRLVTADFSVF